MANDKPCKFNSIHEFSIEDLRAKFKTNTETFFRFVNFQKKKYHNKLNHYDTKEITSKILINCYKQEICSILYQISNFQKVLDEIFGEYDDHIDQTVSNLDLGFSSLKKLYLNLLDTFENQECNDFSGKKDISSNKSPDYVSQSNETDKKDEHSIDEDISFNNSKENFDLKSLNSVFYNAEEDYENHSNESNDENFDIDDSQVENNELLDSIEPDCKESSNSNNNNDSQIDTEKVESDLLDKKASSDSEVENEAHDDTEQQEPAQDCANDVSSDGMSEEEYCYYFSYYQVNGKDYSINSDFKSLSSKHFESTDDSKIVKLSRPEPTDTPPPI